MIQHELLASGAAHATSIEASSAYLAAARSESDRRGLVDRVTYQHGDFVDLAEAIQPADIVTLDRVLNVYPDWERLASLSAERARRLYGVVIPRDTLFVKLVIAGINLVQRLRRKDVRAAIVPMDASSGPCESEVSANASPSPSAPLGGFCCIATNDRPWLGDPNGSWTPACHSEPRAASGFLRGVAKGVDMRQPLRVASHLAPGVLPLYEFLADRLGERLGRRADFTVATRRTMRSGCRRRALRVQRPIPVVS